MEARRRAFEAQATAEHARQLATWRGTELMPEPLPKQADPELFAEYLNLFQREYEVPKERLEFFAELLSPDSKFRVVGWRVAFRSVRVDESGARVSIAVYPSLVGVETRKMVVTNRHTIEEWRVSK